jgi:hypothetical protein
VRFSIARIFMIFIIREGDFGVKNFFFIFRGLFGAAKFLAYAQSNRGAVLSKHAEHTHGTDANPEHTGQELMCSLSIRIRN